MSDNKFKIITYISYFFGIMLLPGILYIPFFFGTLEASQRLLSHKITLIFFILCFVFVVMFFIWVSKAKQGKKYWKMYTKWQKQKIANQAIDEITGTEYYDTLPEYTGENTFDINRTSKTSKVFKIVLSTLTILICILALNIAFKDYTIEFSSVFIPIAVIVAMTIWLIATLNNSRRKTVTIDKQGVILKRKKDGKMKSHFFSWDRIKTIGLSVDYEGRRIQWGYLYFTTKEVKGDRVIVDYFEKPYVIMLKYRPKAVHCVLKYWDKEIKNLEAMKNWLKYINKL